MNKKERIKELKESIKQTEKELESMESEGIPNPTKHWLTDQHKSKMVDELDTLQDEMWKKREITRQKKQQRFESERQKIDSNDPTSIFVQHPPDKYNLDIESSVIVNYIADNCEKSDISGLVEELKDEFNTFFPYYNYQKDKQDQGISVPKHPNAVDKAFEIDQIMKMVLKQCPKIPKTELKQRLSDYIR